MKGLYIGVKIIDPRHDNAGALALYICKYQTDVIYRDELKHFYDTDDSFDVFSEFLISAQASLPISEYISGPILRHEKDFLKKFAKTVPHVCFSIIAGESVQNSYMLMYSATLSFSM